MHVAHLIGPSGTAAVCTKVNAITNGDFETSATSAAPWVLSNSTMQTVSASIHSEFLLGHSIDWLINIQKGSPNLLYMFQTMTLCPSTAYSLSYQWRYQDISASSSGGCTLTAYIGGTLASTIVLAYSLLSGFTTATASYTTGAAERNNVLLFRLACTALPSATPLAVPELWLDTVSFS
jgi:hypothetical protein